MLPSVRMVSVLGVFVLISADLVFIGLHFIAESENSKFSLENEGTYSELFQYVKELTASLIMLLLFLRSRSPLALLGSILFAYLFLDDALGLHEQAGAALKTSLSPLLPAILRRLALFEALFLTLVGGCFTLASVTLYLRSEPAEQHAGRAYMLLLAAFGLCSIGFDALHAIFKTSSLLLVLEDGGELILMSLLLALSLALLLGQLLPGSRSQAFAATAD